MLKVKNISREIGGKFIIKDLSFEVNKGEFVVFLGPNGAGKTTTIKTLVGINKPTSGKIEANGFDSEDRESEYKKQIGYVPDVPLLYDKLTGKEYLELVGSLWGLEEKDYLDNINKYLNLFELYDKKDEYVYTYSFGMKQKLSLCAALINDPEYLILDEPLLNLDPIVCKKIKEFLLDYCKSRHAVFLSTHILEVAEKLYTKVVILKDGHIIADLDRETIKNKYSEVYDLEDIFIKNILS